MKCFSRVFFFCEKKRHRKVAAEAAASGNEKRSSGRSNHSIHYEKSNFSITIHSDERIQQSLNQISAISPSRKAVVPSPGGWKVRPKVYKVMHGTRSICHTPNLEVSPNSQPKRVVVRRAERVAPRSALLVSDVQAKKELLVLKVTRSQSENRDREDSESGVA